MRLYWVTTNCIKNNARFTIKQEREQTSKSVLFYDKYNSKNILKINRD